MTITYGQSKVAQRLKRVYYEGSDTLKTGHGLCYNQDYGTAANVTGDRAVRVEKPSVTNNRWFAGVVAGGYEDGITGPAYLDIVEPGSFAEVWTDASVTIDASFLTLKLATYIFGAAGVGFDGRGSAIAKNTIDRSSTAGTCLAFLQDGEESGGVLLMTAVDNAASTPATPAIGGVQFWDTAATLTAGDSTEVVADAVIHGTRHAVVAGATMTTNDVKVSVTSHVTSDPEEYFLKLTNQYAYMKWYFTSAGAFHNLALTAPTAT